MILYKIMRQKKLQTSNKRQLISLIIYQHLEWQIPGTSQFIPCFALTMIIVPKQQKNTSSLFNMQQTAGFTGKYWLCTIGYKGVYRRPGVIRHNVNLQKLLSYKQQMLLQKMRQYQLFCSYF